MNLIIVESPTKSRTIEKFLGKGWIVRSSYGHIRDLPKTKLGIEIENDFKPNYIIPVKAKARVKELKGYSAKAKKIIIATDEDREGEAIAWHLAYALKLKENKGKNKKYERIAFHEITKPAIESALKHPRDIDINMVNAQQARRILDRIVGYKLSPFLWKKIVKGLSAGRVQSVALRLIVEKEREIEKFKPKEYWSIEALLKKIKRNNSLNSKNEFTALLVEKGGKTIPKFGIKTKKEAEKIINSVKGAQYKAISIEKKESKRNPLPPFTTSSLQQEAGQKLRFSAKRTMMLAQNLYEKGLITYHRTDSLNLATSSLIEAKNFIFKNFGENYWNGYLRTFKTKSKNAQEAHEAIRPSYPKKLPKKLKLDKSHFQLYDLIWRRFIASQMAAAIFNSTKIKIEAKNKEKSPAPVYIFNANGQTLKFKGFLKIYPVKTEENNLPNINEGELLELKKIIPSQHFTKPPARYSEATLIKTLEKEGIGRPSTYAPTLETIQRRNYAQKNEDRRFQPTEIGILINDTLVKHFPNIVDIKFTANMEKNLDDIAKGKKDWVQVLKDFYNPFDKNLKEKYEKVMKKNLIEKTEKKCPKCGAPLVIRLGRFGKFYGCSKFPECKYTERLSTPTLGIKCPKCEKGEIIEKRTKKGKVFYGCDKWPDCDFALWDKPTGEKCPKCGSLLVETKSKKIKCSNKSCSWETKKA